MEDYIKYIHNLTLLFFLLMPVFAFPEAPSKVGPSHKEEASAFEKAADRFLENEAYRDAIDYYVRGMDLSRHLNDKRTYSHCLFGIGKAYSHIGDVDKSLFYLKKSYDEAVSLNDTYLMADAAHLLAASYCIKQDVKGARCWLKVFEGSAWDKTVTKAYYTAYVRMFIQMMEGNANLAIRYGREAIRCAERSRLDDSHIFVCYGAYVYLFLLKGDYRQALKNAESYGRYARKSGKRQRMQGYYEIMRDIYAQKGDTAISRRYALMASCLSDSLIARSQIDSIDNLLLEYQNKESKENLHALNVRMNHHLFINFVFAIIILLLLAITAIVVINNRRMKKAQLQLIWKNDELLNAEKKNKELLQQHYGTPPGGKENRMTEEETIDGGSINMDDERVNQLLSRILAVLEDVATISRTDFNLNMLAQKVGSNTTYTSWVINKTYKKNFKTLLNEYRVREACRCLADEKNYGHLTIQAIYKELGYSSASTFIAAFKNVMGMTPSAYQRRMKENSKNKGGE